MLFRAVLWRAPKYAFGVAGGSYGRLSPRRRRLVVIGGAVALAGLTAGAFVRYPALWKRHFGGASVGANAVPGAEEEICEFLARPAARLYIDGELVAEEIPPLHRTALSVGEHTVRFVSPSGATREITIRVAKRRPKQWFMNFVDGRVHGRPAASLKK